LTGYGLISPVKVYILLSPKAWENIRLGRIYILTGNMSPYIVSRIHIMNMFYCRVITGSWEWGGMGRKERKCRVMKIFKIYYKN
jgi:hypothetical protein